MSSDFTKIKFSTILGQLPHFNEFFQDQFSFLKVMFTIFIIGNSDTHVMLSSVYCFCPIYLSCLSMLHILSNNYLLLLRNYSNSGNVIMRDIWVKLFKNGPSKICGIQALSRPYHFKFFKGSLFYLAAKFYFVHS